MFYFIAIESNEKSTLIFEEPESHSFPFYTQVLGDKIGNDENNNQYFIATHNPSLKKILENTETGCANVFITYVKNYQTNIRQLSDDEVSTLLSLDPFLNLKFF